MTITRRQMVGGAALVAAGARPALAEDALDRLRRDHKLKLGIFNQAPWASVNADGSVGGEAPDVLRAALAPLGGVDIEPVVAEFAALIPGLLAGRFDAVATGLYINPARCKLVAFGNPDIQMGDAFMVRHGNPLDLHSYKDLAKRTDYMVGVNRGSVLVQYIEAAGVAKDRVVLFPDNQAAVAGLLAGRVGVWAGTAASIVYMLSNMPDAGLERAMPMTGWIDASGREVKGHPGVAFRPADTALRDAYNVELEKLRSGGGLLKILQKYGFGETELPPAGLTAAQVCTPA